MQQNKKWLTLLAVACGTFMATLDASIINVALPSITSSFGTGLSQSRWVVIAYLFSITGLLLFFGKIADLVNRKLVFSLGFIVFSAGSFLCGISANMQQLIFFRALQGFGAAMLMSNGPAIITAAFPGNERGKALGILSMAVSSGLAIGPTFGGFLVEYFDWPSIFLINCPIGVLGFGLVYRFVPGTLGMPAESLAQRESLEREQRLPLRVRAQLYFSRLMGLDWLGSVLWLAIQVGFVLVIDRQNILGMNATVQSMVFFGTAAVSILFILWEASQKDPILDLKLFRSRLFFTANMSSLFSFVALSATTLLMPFYLQNARFLTPDRVGLIMTAIPLTTFCIAPFSGRLSDTYGSRFLSTVGMVIVSLAMILLGLPVYGLTTENTNAVIFYLVMIGVGIGLFQSPNNNAIMGDVAVSRLGVASALLATMRNFGLVIGTALGSALLMYFYQVDVRIHPEQKSEAVHFITALRYTFLCMGAVAALGIFSSIMSKK